ncbi:MAG: hypothetical protein AAF772_09520 [Acidobacteriota bacterium]
MRDRRAARRRVRWGLSGLTLLASLALADPAPARDGAPAPAPASWAVLQPGASPHPMDVFAPPDSAAPPSHQLPGPIVFGGDPDDRGRWRVYRESPGFAAAPSRRALPSITLDLVQNDGDLIPRTRGVRLGPDFDAHPHWAAWVGPGRAWQVADEPAWSRASLPFALVARNGNCIHHGVIGFAFNDAAISSIAYQITQEICRDLKFDLWGSAPARVDARADASRAADASAVVDAYRAEQTRRLPQRPLAALSRVRPDVDLARLSADVDPAHVGVEGVWFGGVHYRGPVATRHGAHPYADALPWPSYSLAKAAFAGASVMALTARVDPAVADRALGPVDRPGRAGGDSWRAVTIEHAIDMATGHYGTPRFMADEGGIGMITFFLAETAAARRKAAGNWTRRAAPGARFVYRTSDTFLAVRALDAWLARDADARARWGDDLFAGYVRHVLAPIGAGPEAGAVSLRAGVADPTRSALGGFGLWWTADDLVKLARLFHGDRGQVDGQTILDPQRLAAAMQRDPDDRGLVVDGDRDWRYNDGVWARRPAGADDRTVPYWSGYGGIVVVFLPGDVVYYRVADGGSFAWTSAAAALEPLGQPADAAPSDAGTADPPGADR